MARSIDAHRPDCPCPACRGRQGRASRPPVMGLRLPEDVQVWLRSQPGGAVAWIADQVRMAKSGDSLFDRAHRDPKVLVDVLRHLLSQPMASSPAVRSCLLELMPVERPARATASTPLPPLNPEAITEWEDGWCWRTNDRERTLHYAQAGLLLCWRFGDILERQRAGDHTLPIFVRAKRRSKPRCAMCERNWRETVQGKA